MNQKSVDLIQGKELVKSIQSGASKLLDTILSKDEFLIVEEDYHLLTRDKIQKSIFVKTNRGFDDLIKPILISSAMESEKLSAGSADLALIFSLFLTANLIKNNERKTEKDDFYDQILEIVKENSSYFHFDDFKKIVNQTTDSHQIKEIIKHAIELAGSKNKILVEKSERQESIIQYQPGYCFERELSDETACFFDSKNSWTRKNCNVFIVDGDILSISDIHHLLEDASKNKFSCLLIARSFSSDVFNTLHVNKARGTLDIIPVDIPFEQDTANIIVDVATACNTDIVSPLKGDLISKACKANLPDVKEILINKKGITIINTKADKRCNILLNDLKRRVLEQQHDEIKKILSKRISSLSGSKVKILVGQNLLTENLTAVEDIDKILRMTATMSRSGIIKNKDIIRSIKKINNQSFELSSFYDTLSLFSRDLVFPSTSILLAAKKGLSSFESIKSLSCGLLVNNYALL